VILTVPDIEAATAVYSRVLGIPGIRVSGARSRAG
jgi:catechol 2,3-dioxygenase-like lactoylglutathione lyase family enzyme